MKCVRVRNWIASAMVNIVFGMIGGLGLFLFGMGLMSDAIKDIAGSRMKQFLTALTRKRIVAVMLGAFATMLVQSSSATTVMAVGFVNAGLLNLQQSLCVVLGANVGTTITAWLVSMFGIGRFSVSAYSLPLLGIGFFISILARRSRTRNIGRIMLGFGILFLGVSFMQATFAPIKDCPDAQRIIIRFSSYPLLALLAGTLLTMLMQSSSASIMIIQVLALQGAFGTEDWTVVLNLVIPFILGDNIGTTITAQLAAARASRNAKRAAMGHTIFNVIGVIYILPIVWLGVFGDFISWITPWELTQSTIMADMAAANTIIKVVNTIIFLPLIKLLESIVIWILPVKPHEATESPVVLEEHLLETPHLALQEVARELNRMVEIAEDATRQAIYGLMHGDVSSLELVRKREKQTDEFQYDITSYLSRIARKTLSRSLAAEIPVLLHVVNDLERVGDLAVNIAEVAERKVSQNILFSEDATAEAWDLDGLMREMFSLVTKALQDNDKEAAYKAMEIEDRLNAMQIELRKNHVHRMAQNSCTAEAGLIFIDLVDNVEKIGDHLTNVAQAIIGGLQWSHNKNNIRLLVDKPSSGGDSGKGSRQPSTPASLNNGR